MTEPTTLGFALLFAGTLIAAGVYFLPVIVAWRRGHPQRWPIAILTLFLGWTLVAWVIALAWSAARVR